MIPRAITTIAASCVASFSSPALAQVDTAKLGELVAIIESGDADALAAQDQQVDYLPNTGSVLIPAETAMALLAGCKAQSLDTADNSFGMTMLRFECADRTPPAKCNTGDLDLMVQHRYRVEIAVAEVQVSQQENSECRYLAPPPAPPSTGKY